MGDTAHAVDMRGSKFSSPEPVQKLDMSDGHLYVRALERQRQGADLEQDS